MAEHEPEVNTVDPELNATDVVEGDGATEVNAERQAHAEALQAHLSAPHTQLSQIVKDLQTAPALDVPSRMGQLSNAVHRLIQVIIAHTPEPPPHPGEFKAAPEEERDDG